MKLELFRHESYGREEMDPDPDGKWVEYTHARDKIELLEARLDEMEAAFDNIDDEMRLKAAACRSWGTPEGRTKARFWENAANLVELNR